MLLGADHFRQSTGIWDALMFESAVLAGSILQSDQQYFIISLQSRIKAKIWRTFSYSRFKEFLADFKMDIT